MHLETPPPLPKRPSSSISSRIKLVIGLALTPAFFFGTLLVLRVSGLTLAFKVPTNGMAPAVSADDQIIMEGFSFHFREPRRGDIAVFKTEDIALLPPPAKIFTQRIAGEPGDKVRISEGKLFINDKQVSLTNAEGEIVYNLPSHASSHSIQTEVIVPTGFYFMLGDNSAHSYDSRYWGNVPRSNIIGCVSFCYWPPARMGRVQ